MCKCSYSYLSKLSRTLSERPDYASICTSLVVDMSITCPVKTPVVLDEKPARRFNRFLPGRQRSAVPESKKSVQDCSNEGVDALRSSRFKEILLQLKNVDFVSVCTFKFQYSVPVNICVLLDHTRHIQSGCHLFFIHPRSTPGNPSESAASRTARPCVIDERCDNFFIHLPPVHRPCICFILQLGSLASPRLERRTPRRAEASMGERVERQTFVRKLYGDIVEKPSNL